MRSSATVSVLTLLLALAAGCGDEETRPETLGPPGLKLLIVDDVTGDPLEGIRLYCLDEKGKQLNATSGPDGRHDFGLLIEGPYTVMAGLRERGYLPKAERIEVDGPTERTIRLQTYDGFRLRITVPEGVAPPTRIEILYGKPGKPTVVSFRMSLTKEGLGRTTQFVPGEYEMEFRAPGFRPVKRAIVIPRKSTKPTVVEMVPD